jgi:hypothetical protein
MPTLTLANLTDKALPILAQPCVANNGMPDMPARTQKLANQQFTTFNASTIGPHHKKITPQSPRRQHAGCFKKEEMHTAFLRLTASGCGTAIRIIIEMTVTSETWPLVNNAAQAGRQCSDLIS